MARRIVPLTVAQSKSRSAARPRPSGHQDRLDNRKEQKRCSRCLDELDDQLSDLAEGVRVLAE